MKWKRACGVMVQKVQRVVVTASPQVKKRGAADAAGCAEGLRKKVLRIDGPFRAQGFLSLTGPLAPRVVDCPSGNAYKVSVTD